MFLLFATNNTVLLPYDLAMSFLEGVLAARLSNISIPAAHDPQKRGKAGDNVLPIRPELSQREID